jgi:hypothetical protein
MSPYDKAKVTEFVTLFDDDPAGLFHFLAEFGNTSWQDRLLPRCTADHCRTYEALSPWEKNNVLYALKDRVADHIDILIKASSKVARAADDACDA